MDRIRKNLHSKIFFAFLLIIIMSTVSVMIIWRVNTSKIIYNNVYSQLVNTVEQANKSLEEIILVNEEKSVSIAISTSVRELLNNQFDNDYKRLQKVYEVDNLCNSLLSEKSGLVGITIIDLEGESALLYL